VGKFSDWVIFLVFGCLTFFHLRGFFGTSGENVHSEEMACVEQGEASFVGRLGFEWTTSRQYLLFFIDFRDFLCPSCLDSFLDFYRKLPPRFQKEHALGVLVLDPGREDETSIQIARVKLRGFVLANRIGFPILVDRFHVFREFAREGTMVVLLDYEREIIRKFLFPLRQKDVDEILGCLRIEG
jgi:hypothetical protein